MDKFTVPQVNQVNFSREQVFGGLTQVNIIRDKDLIKESFSNEINGKDDLTAMFQST